MPCPRVQSLAGHSQGHLKQPAANHTSKGVGCPGNPRRARPGQRWGPWPWGMPPNPTPPESCRALGWGAQGTQLAPGLRSCGSQLPSDHEPLAPMWFLGPLDPSLHKSPLERPRGSRLPPRVPSCLLHLPPLPPLAALRASLGQQGPRRASDLLGPFPSYPPSALDVFLSLGSLFPQTIEFVSLHQTGGPQGQACLPLQKGGPPGQAWVSPVSLEAAMCRTGAPPPSPAALSWTPVLTAALLRKNWKSHRVLLAGESQEDTRA